MIWTYHITLVVIAYILIDNYQLFEKGNFVPETSHRIKAVSENLKSFPKLDVSVTPQPSGTSQYGQCIFVRPDSSAVKSQYMNLIPACLVSLHVAGEYQTVFYYGNNTR